MFCQYNQLLAQFILIGHLFFFDSVPLLQRLDRYLAGKVFGADVRSTSEIQLFKQVRSELLYPLHSGQAAHFARHVVWVARVRVASGVQVVYHAVAIVARSACNWKCAQYDVEFQHFRSSGWLTCWVEFFNFKSVSFWTPLL